MTHDLNAWLTFCRRQRPDLTNERFIQLRPEFVKLYLKLTRAKRRGTKQ